jgi:hypothetical protein
MVMTAYCPELGRLMDEWITAAAAHAKALTDFNRSLDVASSAVRIRERIDDLKLLREKVANARRDLDAHREQHG